MISFEPSKYGSLDVIQITILDDNKNIGFYLFVPQGIDVYEVHTHFEKEAWGSAKVITEEALIYIFNYLPEMNTLLTKVPENNPLAKKLAEYIGMSVCGRIPRSFKTPEGFIDQDILYINRENI